MSDNEEDIVPEMRSIGLFLGTTARLAGRNVSTCQRFVYDKERKEVTYPEAMNRATLPRCATIT
ncbi:hypothetical protein TNCV_857771 [Trichonephila clavipes]|nr:hypothetical protein TNCV_857771 [Trichonephila clavipes]